MTIPAGLPDHPAAWRGPDLLARDDWRHMLDGEERRQIAAALRDWERRVVGTQPPNAASFPLTTLATRLASIQDALENGPGVALLQGFPTDSYSEPQCEKAFFGLMSHLGTPVSQSALGERLFHVRDEGHGESSAKTRGPNSSKGLSFHTDRCDVIAFLCLRQAQSGGENQFVSSVTVFNQIRQRRPDLLEVLLQPFYYKRHNVDSANARPFCRQPVFAIHQGYFAANLLRVLIDRAYALPELPAMTEQQREALDYLEQVAADPRNHLEYRQQTGDLLLLNNFVTFHRRAAFEDHQDPSQRRHLLRIWLSVPNSRPLHPLFAENYGDTRAGALRGGMRAATKDTP